jgi:hypothetical protein
MRLALTLTLSPRERELDAAALGVVTCAERFKCIAVMRLALTLTLSPRERELKFPPHGARTSDFLRRFFTK